MIIGGAGGGSLFRKKQIEEGRSIPESLLIPQKLKKIYKILFRDFGRSFIIVQKSFFEHENLIIAQNHNNELKYLNNIEVFQIIYRITKPCSTAG